MEEYGEMVNYQQIALCFLFVSVALFACLFPPGKTHIRTTVAILNDVSIESVSRMLGHKHIATTQIYAKMPDVMVERQAEKLFKIG